VLAQPFYFQRAPAGRWTSFNRSYDNQRCITCTEESAIL